MDGALGRVSSCWLALFRGLRLQAPVVVALCKSAVETKAGAAGGTGSGSGVPSQLTSLLNSMEVSARTAH